MAGVNVKMGVSGVSQFKRNMTDAKNALKTLDAQMALNEKQFKATGDAESYMQQKSELLQKKLEEQKSIVKNAEDALKQMTANGVDKASKAYQDMLQALAKAKGDLIDTESAMSGVAESGDNVTNSVETMNNQLKKVGDGVSYQNILTGLDSISDGIKGVITKAWQMGEAIVRATLGAGSWADELATTAAQYEITPEQLQRMRKTANVIDTDVDTIISAQQKLRQGVGKRDKEAMGAFAALFGDGYDPTTKNATDVFWDAGEALMKLDDEYDKQVYAQKLFGKSWRELIPLFSTGRDEYEKTMESWSVVEDDQLDGLTKMDDQYQKMTSEWETFKIEMLSAFSGPLTEGMETITGLFQELNKYLDTPEGQNMLSQLGETVSGLISDLTNLDPESAVAGLKGIVDGITTSLAWISEHNEEVKLGLEVIAGGFAAIKVTQLATNIASIVSGFKTLWGGANKPLPTLDNVGGSTAAEGGLGGAVAKVVSSTAAQVAAGVAAGVAVLTQGLWDPNYSGKAEGVTDQNGNLTAGAKKSGYWMDANGVVHAPNENPEDLEVLKMDPEEAHKAAVKRGEGTDWGGTGEVVYVDRHARQGSLPEPDDAAALDNAVSKMESAASELVGDSSTRKQTSSELSAAAGSLSGVRGDISAGIKDGFANVKIVIDGQSAGQALTPYIGGNLGNMVALVR